MNPTEPNTALSAPTPPVVGQDLVEYVRTNRETTSYFLFGLSVLFLAMTIWAAVSGFRQPASTKPTDKAATKNPFEEFNPDKEKEKQVEITNPKKIDWLIGAAAALGGFLIVAGAGAWFLVTPPQSSEDKQRTEARKLILGVGCLLGVLISLAGLAYFYQWSDSLIAWLDKDVTNTKAWKSLVPLGIIVFGAGVAFVAAQPARAEERNNALLRRLVYSTNFYLTVLLVFVILVAGNVVFALKAPNTLDATESGFYTLSDTTKSFLQRLDQPITAYLVLPAAEGREVTDIRQVLTAYHESSNGRFIVRFVSPIMDKGEVRRLVETYPKMDKDGMGILLVSGSEDRPQQQKHGWIPIQELFTQEMSRDGKGMVQAFAGEGRLLKEVRILAEVDIRPVIYFTQSNGEMALASRGTPDAAVGERSIGRLQQFLESSFSVEVKPLVFKDEANPAIPDDAAIVAVADPKTPLPEPTVRAIRNYMAQKKGKLIVLAGATTAVEGRKMATTGLEGLLMEYNVDLGSKFLYTNSMQIPPYAVVPEFKLGGASGQNPIVQTLGRAYRPFIWPNCRVVNPLTQGGGGNTATAIMQTTDVLETWLEDEELTRFSQTIQGFRGSASLAAQKQLTRTPRPIIVAVSEPSGTGRAVVIGNGIMFSDEVGQILRQQTDSPLPYNIFGVSVDWLRERPPLPSGVSNKIYVEYTMPEAVALNNMRLKWLPLGIGLIVVLALGVGIWAVRRR